MYDKSLVLEQLQNIEKSLIRVLDRTSDIKTPDDFTLTPHGVDMLDVATIRLMACGEEIRKIEKRTNGTLLSQYPDTDWRGVVEMRNFIAHDYHRVEAEIVFDTVQNDVRPLLTTIQKIISDLKNNP
ncbi:MAG: DUF86 domain-containing protein [Bacteroidales bacterium]|nr:DUF86 domain-containing protein [Bacteroidales bacterium]